MARPSLLPDALRGRTLLDAAAFVCLNLHHADIEPHVLAYLEDSPPDSDDDEALMAVWDRAGQRYLAELFPSVAEEDRTSAWSRAQALDRIVTRAVAREMGYPSMAGTPEIDPQVAAPGFGADVYRTAWDDALFALR